ncbi:MAG: tRNA (adenosine(37)-N6)-dimethylallyltransferase MiaA [Bacillota bacterium]
MRFLAKHPLFVLVGPTAVGKTKISIEIAKEIGGEIISADSMQVYIGLDIGTAKIKPQEAEGIPHYLIDIKKPTEFFSAAEFKTLCEEKINFISKGGNIPMLVGGTGLYINSLINDYDFTENANVAFIRQSLWEECEKRGIEFLRQRLKEIDPASWERLHPNDHKRIIRALEVFSLTGRPISSYHNAQEDSVSKYNLTMVGLIRERENLYNRINLRVDLMIKEGWIEEVKSLLEKGTPRSAPAFQGLGYKQLVSFLSGEISLEEAVELIKRDTRRYAKRQVTWFKRDKRIHWIDVDKNKEKDVIKEIMNLISRSIQR